MSLVSANLKYATQSRADDTTREYTAHYVVTVTDATDGPLVVRSGLPALGTVFFDGSSFDTYAYAYAYGSIAPIKYEEGGRTHWTAEVLYSTRPPRRRCTDDVDQDPTALPPIIWGGGVRERKPITVDKDGLPVTNSAGDLFEDTADASRQVLYIQQNQANIDEEQFDEFTDAVNDSAFFGLGPRKWKMEPPQWRQQFYGNCGVYYEVTYQFISARDTWDYKPADRGYRYLADDGAGGLEFRLFADDDTGQRAVLLGNLDGAGNKQIAIGLGVGFADRTIYFDGQGGNPDPYELYPTKDFGLLGIPIAR